MNWDAINGVSALVAAVVAAWMARRDVLRTRSSDEKERLAKSESDQITAQYLDIKQRFVEVQNRLLAIEETRERDRTKRRAELRGRLRHDGGHSYSLVVSNRGTANAKNISVFLDGTPIEKHDSCFSGNSFPRSIPSNDEASLPLGFDNSCAPPFALRITWEDESGSPDAVESTINW